MISELTRIGMWASTKSYNQRIALIAIVICWNIEVQGSSEIIIRLVEGYGLLETASCLPKTDAN